MDDLAILRHTLREKRRHLPNHTIITASQQVFQKTISLPAFQQCQHIACYFSHENEIDPHSIVDYAKKHNKQLYFPVIDHKALQFYLIDQHTKYEKNIYKIPEPVHQHNAFFPIPSIDLFLIPLVAFDAQCHRIGRGMGYYDRTLAHRNKNAILIGLAYEFQKVDRIVPQDWDVDMHYVVTEKTIYTECGCECG